MSTTPEKPVNKQLFSNSRLADLFQQDQQTARDPRETFFNQKDPNLAILHEKPHHRLLILLKLSGRSNREIAAESGYSEAWLSQLFRQPWAVQEMARITTEAGTDGIRGLLLSECVPSIMKLAELRDDPETPHAVQKSACDSLIQQYLGKPPQSVTVTDNKAAVNADTLAAVEDEIKQLQEEQRKLLNQ